MHFDMWWWVLFTLGVVILLVLDITVFHKKNVAISSKTALKTTYIWVILALLFAGLVYMTKGSELAIEFLAGYVIEKSLSIDNLFVFLLIFQHFAVPEQLRYKLLMQGILGALVMRFLFIIIGITLIQKIHWILYVFGAFLVVTGCLLFKRPEREIKFENNVLVKLLQKWFPKLGSNPSFLVLVTIESTDLIFALDSIPAVFAVTLEPFIVYSCTTCAILGLRPLFFVLQNLASYFSLLHYGVCLILILIGLKMLLGGIITIPITYSLLAVVSIITGTLLLSRFVKKGSCQ